MNTPRNVPKSLGSKVDGRIRANSKRKVQPERMRALKVDGHVARQAYLVDALRHLARYQSARVHSLAFALFPARTKRSAHDAVQRVLRNAVASGYVEFAEHPRTQHRYYALTRAGADFLQHEQPELGAVEQTASSLKKGNLMKAEHREWTSMLEVAANYRAGMLCFDEYRLQSVEGADIRPHLDQHLPDALTFVPGERLVLVHEVETSRRSRWTKAQQKKEEEKVTAWAKMRAKELQAAGRKTADGNAITWQSLYRRPQSGTDRFSNLVRYFRKLRRIPFAFPGSGQEKDFEVALIVHCGSTLIRDELCRLVRALPDSLSGTQYFIREVEKNTIFEMPYEGKGTRWFTVRFELLPPRTDDVWHNTRHLPVQGASLELRPEAVRNERFIAGAAGS